MTVSLEKPQVETVDLVSSFFIGGLGRAVRQLLLHTTPVVVRGRQRTQPSTPVVRQSPSRQSGQWH
jgi:hypothetical protein